VVAADALTHGHERQTRLIEPAGLGKLLVGESLPTERHAGLVEQLEDRTLAEPVGLA
jgi:hypothetical protein